MSSVPSKRFLKFLQQSDPKNKWYVGGGAALLVVAVVAGMNALSTRSKKGEAESLLKNTGQAKTKKASVNKEFFRTFSRFWPIIVPGALSRESFIMFIIALILISRTYLDFWMIANNANIMGAVVKRNYKQFLRYILEFGFMQIPTSFVNNMLHFLIDKLALCFRERLTYYMHQRYLNSFTYYGVSNLDNRIDNADQLLTQDIENFSKSVSTLYSNITKPLMDVLVFYNKLVQGFGWGGPTLMLGYFVLAGAVMTKLRSPFAWFASTQAKLEGEYRYCHSRLITHGEEIAFYGGGLREKGIINTAFQRMTRIINKYLRFRTLLGVLDSCATKYSATLVGYFIVTAPIFDPKRENRYLPELGGDPKLIMEDYTRYMRLLIVMVRAVGRLVASGRELSHLAGYTSRVALLDQVLRDMSKGTYVRTLVKKQSVHTEEEEKEEGEGGEESRISVIDKTEEKTMTVDPLTQRGKLIEVDEPIIKFEDVPIITPNGDVLVKSLSFEIKAGMNCLIAGPNGCGKSSLFRILGDLWPLCGGTLTRPKVEHLFYIPQRPYLVIGTLRDQIIYPHTKEEMHRAGLTDEDLMELVKKVELGYVIKREGGWDAVADWWDVLSGGEKQRIAMARLFYHRPKFAVLDECTSAVSMDVEAGMYEYCKEIGCTLFTISHRKSLWKFHEYVLEFDGRGGYRFFHLDDSYEGF